MYHFNSFYFEKAVKKLVANTITITFSPNFLAELNFIKFFHYSFFQIKIILISLRCDFT